jgi:hypothetical protein
MWKILCGSFVGASHLAANTECQDHCCAKSLAQADDDVLVLACADGAGSAEHSSLGAQLACEQIVEAIEAALRESGQLVPVTLAQAQGWFRTARDRLIQESAANEFELKSLACTLLVAVVGARGSAFMQVGDGAIVVRSVDEYQHVFWPQHGEYANTTNFVTSLTSIDGMAFEWREACVDEVALFTDGLQMLALDFRGKRAHQPFFAPIFAQLRSAPNADELQAPFRDFLTSSALDERTDDDKTLMLAIRTLER